MSILIHAEPLSPGGRPYVPKWLDLLAALLDGHKILGLYVAEGEETAYLSLDNGVLLELVTEADCCSETWFADITGVNGLLNQPILSLATPEMPEVNDDRSRQESDSAYCLQISTPHTRCELIYRNSSNGYYGGGIRAVQLVERVPRTARPITEDWSA